MANVRRIRALLAARGLLGLLRAVYRRLVYNRWHSLVYRDDPVKSRLASFWPPGYRFECWELPSQLPAEARAALAETVGHSGVL